MNKDSYMRGSETMNNLRLSIEKVLKGAGKSFYRFPTAIASAIVISDSCYYKDKNGMGSSKDI